MSLVAHFGAEHARLVARLPGAGDGALDHLRAQALERFSRLGMPTTRQEDWKYTSLAALERRPLPVAEAPASLPSAALLQSRALALESACRLVFVDGRHAPALSSLTLPAGAFAGSLAARLAGGATQALPALDEHDSALAALNLAFGADGAELTVPAGIHVEAPVVVLFVGTQPERSAFPSLRVRLGADASATVVEQHLCLHQGAALNTMVSRIELAAGASLRHVKLQQEGERVVHLADTAARLAAGARLHSLVLALGGQIAREDLRVALAGTHAGVELCGLYLARARRHLDHHTCVVHAVPDCTSRQDYRGILDDAGRAVFNGRVVVAKDAQRTDAQQSNANLLLSDNAEIDTKPQLEILADDVRCSHGATVGQLDPAELFYLRSRGLDEVQARTLVTLAFAARALSTLERGGALYAGLRRALLSALPGGDRLETLEP